MGGIVNGKKHKSFIVNGVADHVHMLISLNPALALSDLIRDVKNNSTNFLNEKKFISGKFCWQESFGAFSVSASNVDKVYKYIENHEAHHSKKTFRKEYLDFLIENNISYNEKYLFEFYD